MYRVKHLESLNMKGLSEAISEWLAVNPNINITNVSINSEKQDTNPYGYHWQAIIFYETVG